MDRPRPDPSTWLLVGRRDADSVVFDCDRDVLAAAGQSHPDSSRRGRILHGIVQYDPQEQAASGAPTPGALGRLGDAVLILSGHDTNLSNLSGMLGLAWRLPGYQPDDTPPGGALLFSLWRQSGSGQYFLKLRDIAQSLGQMRRAERLSAASPPEGQDLALPGCTAAGCSWETARRALEKSIHPQFTDSRPASGPASGR